MKGVFEKLPKQTSVHRQVFVITAFSGANMELQAWSFRETKSFSVIFNQNRAGVLTAPESCLEERVSQQEKRQIGEFLYLKDRKTEVFLEKYQKVNISDRNGIFLAWREEKNCLGLSTSLASDGA